MSGEPEALASTVESLAQAVVMVDASDLPALAELHTQLERVVAGCRERGAGDVADGFAAAAARVEALVLGDEPDPAGLLSLVAELTEQLQGALGADGDVDSTKFKPAAAPADAGDPALSAAAPPPADEESAAGADPDLLAEFVSEAEEHLQAAEASLLSIETDPDQPDAVNAVFRAFHTIKGVSGFLGLKAVGELAHEAENLLDRARKGELLFEGPAIDVSLETVDALRSLVVLITAALAEGRPPTGLPHPTELIGRIRTVALGRPDEKLGEILSKAGVVEPEEVAAALERQQQSEEPRRLGEELVRGGEAAARDVALALRVQNQGRGESPKPAATTVAEAVKVDAERLDRLIDLIGELVIAESMVVQAPELAGFGSSRIGRHLTRLDKITRELQELGTSLRMTPIRPLFQKMTRLARDVARKAAKAIEVSVQGEDTELDKTVIDLLGDPLVHMVRNAVDHGLEPDAAARASAGKSAAGRVTLRAYHQGGSIHVEVVDDGRGLDREAILAKAVSRGLVAEGATLTDREIHQLIFEPGFSTAAKVTDVSGRGVGMDVVRRNVESLRGTIEIDSERGAGSLFRIRLPLTLAVIDGMLVRVATERYILPTSTIVTSVRPTPEQLSTVVGRGELLRIQGELLPLFRLAGLFALPGGQADATQALAVVIESDGEKVCLLVDELLGQQQIVIKGLDESIKHVDGLSGAAILPDGRVGLILDVSGLVRLATAAPDARGLAQAAG